MAQRVLIVDDDPLWRRLAVRFLRPMGFDIVAEAADGLEALAVLRERGVDLIVTDWQMPRLDGPGLARRLRAGGDRTPIIMLSAVDDDRAAADALAAGASCYVVKSLDSRLLSQAVRLALSAAA